LRDDEKDFVEFGYSLNEEEVEYEDELSKLQTQVSSPDHNTMFLNPSYYDVQKLLINEKGDERYNELRRKKNKRIQQILDD
jgi:flagellar biosynthesis regulator FlbT